MIQPYLTPPPYREFEASLRSSENTTYEVETAPTSTVPDTSMEQPQLQSYPTMSPRTWYRLSESKTPWFEYGPNWSNSAYGNHPGQQLQPVWQQNPNAFYEPETVSSGTSSISPGLGSSLSYREGSLSCEGCA